MSGGNIKIDPAQLETAGRLINAFAAEATAVLGGIERSITSLPPEVAGVAGPTVDAAISSVRSQVQALSRLARHLVQTAANVGQAAQREVPAVLGEADQAVALPGAVAPGVRVAGMSPPGPPPGPLINVPYPPWLPRPGNGPLINVPYPPWLPRPGNGPLINVPHPPMPPIPGIPLPPLRPGVAMASAKGRRSPGAPRIPQPVPAPPIPRRGRGSDGPRGGRNGPRAPGTGGDPRIPGGRPPTNAPSESGNESEEPGPDTTGHGGPDQGGHAQQPTQIQGVPQPPHPGQHVPVIVQRPPLPPPQPDQTPSDLIGDVIRIIYVIGVAWKKSRG
jgi:hypothetical protein